MFKKVVKFFAIFLSFERSLPFSTNIILVGAVTLSLKNGLLLFQNSLLSVLPFMFTLFVIVSHFL